uniref:Uncharacterized protein n=1 Tax=Romanomermis culicivorax TaxID=13658 RepID=A0A915LC62_ROMCU
MMWHEKPKSVMWHEKHPVDYSNGSEIIKHKFSSTLRRKILFYNASDRWYTHCFPTNETFLVEEFRKRESPHSLSSSANSGTI